MASRIVITGGGGQVGRFLAAELAARERDLLTLTSSQWDITDPAAGRDIVAPGDVVVNCAALTAVDVAEADELRAHSVNGTGAGNVARTCAAVGARLIHISTDYVFSGRFSGDSRPYEIDDPVGPCNVYGRSKLQGEQEVHAALPDAHVVRTAWVYTGAGTDFVATMRRLAAERDTVEVVADQTGSPTYVADLVSTLIQIADHPVPAPILHVANTGACSRYELARAVFTGIGVDPGRVRPVSTDLHPRPAPRPVYSALSTELSATQLATPTTTGPVAAGRSPMRSWQAGLNAALAALR